jgi:hypothetical protein
MIPLERAGKKNSPVEPIFSKRLVRRAPQREQTQPPAPRKFKILDLMTREPLVDGGDAREAIEVLREARSIVDVNVYVWQEGQERWRLLTQGEKRAIWELSQN